jgi:S-ribosylhomocysteine lyase LuxS involved in autoinducer biosynthesis
MRPHFKLDAERDEAGFFLVATVYWSHHANEQYEYPKRFASKQEALMSPAHQHVLDLLQRDLLRAHNQVTDSQLYIVPANLC